MAAPARLIAFQLARWSSSSIHIGLQRGIITPALFAALVVMAVLTTLMAVPVFDLQVGRGEAEGNQRA